MSGGRRRVWRGSHFTEHWVPLRNRLRPRNSESARSFCYHILGLSSGSTQHLVESCEQCIHNRGAEIPQGVHRAVHIRGASSSLPPGVWRCRRPEVSSWPTRSRRASSSASKSSCRSATHRDYRRFSTRTARRRGDRGSRTIRLGKPGARRHRCRLPCVCGVGPQASAGPDLRQG